MLQMIRPMAIGALLWATTASGVEIRKIAGHEVVVEGSIPEIELKVDGRNLHQDAIISFDDLVVLDGTLALIGLSSASTNSPAEPDHVCNYFG